jgi:uncharacterized protein YdeI (YjbR/CyaY-like superfamily)
VKPVFFKTPLEFRNWLEEHHASARELVVGFLKKHTGRPSVTWPETIDQALCFGWIDGIRKRIDEDSYSVRFTPRRAGSIWSEVNTNRVEQLKKLGLMQPAGLRAFAVRDAEKTKQSSLERKNSELAPEYLERFQEDPQAWQFFQAQPPSYRKAVCAWVMSAKQPATRDRRLATLIAECQERCRISLLSPKIKAPRKANRK